jgi:anhydro-N-acetylmuramic acid kinase
MSILAIGAMSGTSLDGIDLALCRFTASDSSWKYDILAAKTVEYSSIWKRKLQDAPNLSAQDFLMLHNEYGCFLGRLIHEFLVEKEQPSLVASHGHTIFHQPNKKFTFQLGHGASIAATTGISTISDFRSLDVALGGQGAPLVPMGDKLLFSEFEYCLNIGGFANISQQLNGDQLAFDICPANIILNQLAQSKNQEYDADGAIGAAGQVNSELLSILNKLPYYQQKYPKSLGREWVESQIMPLLLNSGLSIEDQAATIYEHITDQISLNLGAKGKLLLTGGGAHNTFFVEKLKTKTSCEISLPDQNLINFKEALIFAFLGVLAFKGQINVQATITGSSTDHIGGMVTQMVAKT